MFKCFLADVANKGQFIGCVNSIIRQFGFAHPAYKMELLVTYGYSFYATPLWGLYDSACVHLYSTWYTVVCRLYDLPRTTHTK